MGLHRLAWIGMGWIMMERAEMDWNGSEWAFRNWFGVVWHALPAHLQLYRDSRGWGWRELNKTPIEGSERVGGFAVLPTQSPRESRS